LKKTLIHHLSFFQNFIHGAQCKKPAAATLPSAKLISGKEQNLNKQTAECLSHKIPLKVCKFVNLFLQAFRDAIGIKF